MARCLGTESFCLVPLMLRGVAITVNEGDKTKLICFKF